MYHKFSKLKFNLTHFQKFIILMTSIFYCHCALAVYQNISKHYLLKPTGEYKVGFQDFRLVDGNLINSSYFCPGKSDLFYTPDTPTQIGNKNSFGEDNQIDFCREIMVRVYYPSLNKYNKPNENYYFPAIKNLQESIGNTVSGISQKDLDDLKYIKTHSIRKSGIAKNTKFPVLIFAPGSGVLAQEYENILEELASHGYITVAINNTFIGSQISFPDGRLVQTALGSSSTTLKMADDTVLNDFLFVRNLLSNQSDENPLRKMITHMDLSHVGLFGHSIAGISVVQSIRNQENTNQIYQAAVSYDAPPVSFESRAYSSEQLNGFKIPFMRLFGAEWRSLLIPGVPPEAQFQLLKDNYYALLSPSEEITNYTNHMSFSDDSTLQYQPTIKSFYDTYPGGNYLGTASGKDVAKIINSYTLQFFDQYLKGIPSKNLNSCFNIKIHDTESTLRCSDTN